MTSTSPTPVTDPSPGPSARRARAPRSRTPRQVEESARNRAEILHAALEVFAERGYAATTLEAIARLVGLTRQGVLHHFASKDVLFAEVIDDQEQWARHQYSSDDPPGADGELEGLRVLVPFIGRTDASRSRLQMVQVLQGEAMSHHTAAHTFATRRLVRVRAEIAARLERAREAGELRPGLDLEATATLLTAAVNGLQAQWLLDDTVDTGVAFDQLLALVGVEPSEPGEPVPPAADER